MTLTHTDDAALIALGDRLVSGIFAEREALAGLAATGQIENDDALHAACQPLSAIIRQIKLHQPSTMAGMAVHRLAIDWVSGTLPAELDAA